MCGIAGFAGSPNRPVLERMVETLFHRGPDGSGYWEGPEVSLGMRRLAIIDVETGQQPVFNEDGSIVLVFNGEIYNHIELREELQQQGHRFRSDHSDSEVIVHLYEQHGLGCLDRLNGMFAIALWDERLQRLFLARDRAGIKPLYFARTGEGLIFGSEPKAILAHPAVPRDPDFAAIDHYFSFKNIPAPASAFAAIRQLRAGEWLTFSRGALEQRRWWHLQYREDESITEAEAAETIRALLEDSVRLHMRSDVPFGAYLSGGVDSSSVVALMSRILQRPVVTFTLTYENGFRNKDADRDFARQVSQLYDTEHHEQVVRPADIPTSIEAIVQAFDEPYSGVISTFFLTELISRHVKVALSGDGADEMFGSYLSHRLARPLEVMRRAVGRATNFSPDELAALGPYRDAPEVLERIVARGDEAAARMGQYIRDDGAKGSLYSDRMLSLVGNPDSEALVRSALSGAETGDALNRILGLDFETLLPDQVLAFVDRLSMAHSVEVRPPFLDHRLIEYTGRLPGALKISGARVKHILKEAVRGLLPDEVLDRPKEGFLMPINAWLFGPLRGFVQDILAPARIARHGLWRPEVVRRMVESLGDGQARNADGIWNLMMFQLWWERYIEG